MKIKYITEQGANNLKNFSYNGICESILYKYALSPIAENIVNNKKKKIQFFIWKVDHMPIWLAPNLITMIGFMFLISSTIVNVVYNPTFGQTMPSWVYFYSAFCLCLYQTFDNCDGKQARRTKSSTGLGMLLDHGADCVAQWIIGIQVLSIFQIGQGYQGIVGWVLISNISFYFGIYSQKYTGIFKLGKINGVDEGLPILQLLMIITGVFGSDMWESSRFFGLQNKFYMIFIFHTANINEIINFLIPSAKILGTFTNVMNSLKQVIFYLTTVTLIALGSPKYFSEHFILTILILGFQWSKMINLLQLSLITKEKSTRPNYSWYTIQIILIISVIFNILFQDLIPVQLFLWVMVISSSFSYFKCIYFLIKEMAEILEIKVFMLKPKQI